MIKVAIVVVSGYFFPHTSSGVIQMRGRRRRRRRRRGRDDARGDLISRGGFIIYLFIHPLFYSSFFNGRGTAEDGPGGERQGGAAGR